MVKEEVFTKEVQKKKSKLWQKFDKLTEGKFGYVFYAMLGIVIAYLLNQSLVFALSTNYPVVAVVSDSMTHDSTTEANHFQWLEQNLGYSRNYIDSWPVKDGFLKGDMPIVEASDNYKIGDVVVYSKINQRVPIIHRIIKINIDGTFVTKGDHNPADDISLGIIPKPLTSSQIHGKVIFIIPKLGYFKVAISSLLGEI
jgi:signal peptidase I